MRHTPQAVVADLGATPWQDVLQEPLEKLDTGEGDGSYVLRPVVAIAKRDVVIGDRLQSAVGDRVAEHIPPEVVERTRCPRPACWVWTTHGVVHVAGAT